MTIEKVVVPAEVETPEQNTVNPKIETPEKKFDWARDIRIEVPLNEFMKMKKKISKLQNKCKELEKKADDQRSQRWKIESAYDKLKADYQKILGIDEQKGDDGK